MGKIAETLMPSFCEQKLGLLFLGCVYVLQKVELVQEKFELHFGIGGCWKKMKFYHI